MAQHHHARTFLRQFRNGRAKPFDARAVRDAAILDRHIQIRAQQYALTLGRKRINRLESHDGTSGRGAARGALPRNKNQREPNNAAVSLMRFEKPHSLSYQDSTRTKPPSTTCVCVASKVEDAGLWLKSMLTSGSVL